MKGFKQTWLMFQMSIEDQEFYFPTKYAIWTNLEEQNCTTLTSFVHFWWFLTGLLSSEFCPTITTYPVMELSLFPRWRNPLAFLTRINKKHLIQSQAASGSLEVMVREVIAKLLFSWFYVSSSFSFSFVLSLQPSSWATIPTVGRHNYSPDMVTNL